MVCGVQVLMEVVAVNSAVYSVVLSLVVCMCAVAIFTGHILMLVIVTVTIIGEWPALSALCGHAVATFYLCGAQCLYWPYSLEGRPGDF